MIATISQSGPPVVLEREPRQREMHSNVVEKEGFVGTADEISMMRKMFADLNNEDFELFIHQCRRRNLDPLARQIYAIKRGGRLSIETSIDGFRLIAERTEKYAGQLGPFWCGEDGQWVDVWVSNSPPVAAKVGVLRHDFKEALWGTAKFSSYNPGNSSLWKKMPEVMISKCAEAVALRRAFPNELSGLYTTDEMAQTGTEESPASHAGTRQQAGQKAEAGDITAAAAENEKNLSPEQLARVQELLKETQTNLDQFLAYIGVSALEKMSEVNGRRAIKALENKKKMMAHQSQTQANQASRDA